MKLRFMDAAAKQGRRPSRRLSGHLGHHANRVPSQASSNGLSQTEVPFSLSLFE